MTDSQSNSVIEVPAFSRREDRDLPVVPQTPMAMLSLAVARGMDVATIKGLMELQQQWEKNEARKAYYDAFAAFKAEAVEIIKRKRVYFTNKAGSTTDYKHAELSDVVDALAPPLSRNGFSWGWTPVQEKGWITVTCTLSHKLGHSESVALGAPPDDSGGKNGVQQIISTVTYLERHTLKAICGVSEKGDDNDGAAQGMPDADLKVWSAKIEAATTKAAAKEVYMAAVKECRRLKDVGAANALKEALMAHAEFIDKAGK